VGWQRLLPKFLSSWGKPTAGFSSFTTLTPEVMLWFDHPRVPGGSGYDYVCSLVHDDGTEVPFRDNRYQASWTPTNSVEGRPSPYPQREKLLRVRVYDQRNYDSIELLGEFTLRNPNVVRAPKTPAPPLPQRANDDELDVTLVSLETGARRSKWDKTNILNQYNKARFRILERGAPSKQWNAGYIEATDSMGGRIVSSTWSGGNEKDMELIHTQPMLWPSESYKLRVEFYRKDNAMFQPSELWEIRGIAVPTNGTFTLMGTQWNNGAFTVRLLGMNSRNGQPPWDRLYSGEPTLRFSLSAELKGHRFSLIRVTDELGRKVETSGYSSSGTNFAFGLRPKDTAQTLDVTVALHRSHYLDFQAQPKEWDGRYSQ